MSGPRKKDVKIRACGRVLEGGEWVGAGVLELWCVKQDEDVGEPRLTERAAALRARQRLVSV